MASSCKPTRIASFFKKIEIGYHLTYAIMGKVKNRQRLHNKAAKAAKSASADGNQPTGAMDTLDEASAPAKASSVVGGGIFSGLNINLDGVVKDLPDLDARSEITSKTFKGQNISKKDKRKMKHEFFMKKIDAVQTAKREAKEKKKREKTAIVGDLRPLEDTLPTLELLLKEGSKSSNDRDRVVKPKAIKKTWTRKKQMMDDISLFTQVLQHPAYKSNPLATITEHVKNKQKMEERAET